MYCEEGQCVYKSSDEMARCETDEECSTESGYYCVANICDKLPPEYYRPGGPEPPPLEPPPEPSTPEEAAQQATFTLIAVAAGVVGSVAYLIGKGS